MLWKCKVEGCDYVSLPTVEGYQRMTGHQLSHSVKDVAKAEKGPKNRRNAHLVPFIHQYLVKQNGQLLYRTPHSVEG